MITFDKGVTLINGKRTFLYGAEFHYFRVDPAHWRNRLELIRQAGFNLISTYIPWLWHEPVQGEWDFTGRTHPRRDLTQFLSLCREMGFYCIVRPGPYVMSELKNEGIPQWLLDSHPEVIARSRDGSVHPMRVAAYRHPVFLDLAARWYERVIRCILPFLATHGGPVIMFQLDNEVGMLHWVTNTADHHPETLHHLAQYLELKYGQIETINSLVGSDAGSFAEWADRLDVWRERAPLAFHWLWADFWRDEFFQYIRELREFAQARGIDVPYIVNVHGFKDYSVYSRGVDYPIGLSQLRETVRVPGVILAGDFYPGRIGYDNAHDLVLATVLTEAMGTSQQPVFSAEFQSGRLSDRPRVSERDLDLITRICVAHGMNALNYYMFCGGDNPEGIGLFGRRHEWQAPIAGDGALRPSYGAAQSLGRLFATFNELLCQTRKAVDTHIGFYSPYYATETVQRDLPQLASALNDVAAQREHMHFDGLWRLLVAANISFRAVDLRADDGLDVQALPTLFVAATQYMDATTQERLRDYVAMGGTLVIAPRMPHLNLFGAPCRILADAVGLGQWQERRGFLRVNVLGTDSVFCRQHLVFDGIPADEAIAFGEGGAGEVAGFVRPHGKGTILVLGVGLAHEYDYAVDVMRQIARRAGVSPRLALSDGHLFAAERVSDNGRLLFINNACDSALTTTVSSMGERLFGGNSVTVPAGAGVMLPLYFAVRDDLLLEYSTWEIEEIIRGKGDVRLQLRTGGEMQGMVRLRGPYRVVAAINASCDVHSDGQSIEIRFSAGQAPSCTVELGMIAQDELCFTSL